VTVPRVAAVVGLGLIGGSLARDLAARGVRVLGADRDAAAVRAAMEAGVVAAALGPGLEGVEEADTVVLAVPVSAASALLASAAPRLRGARLVTDAGSTKRGILAAATGAGLGDRFVGGHPLAGDHRAGWDASRAGLFAGARVFLCPAPEAGDRARGLARALWTAVGGVVEEMEADAHDAGLAWRSHLPQAASTALAGALAAAGVPRSALGPGGRDATRLAGSSPEVWSAILMENADHVGDALRHFERWTRALRTALDARDAAAVERMLDAARRWSAE
jgi:prephenate dehydrogenase